MIARDGVLLDNFSADRVGPSYSTFLPMKLKGCEPTGGSAKGKQVAKIAG